MWIIFVVNFRFSEYFIMFVGVFDLERKLVYKVLLSEWWFWGCGVTYYDANIMFVMWYVKWGFVGKKLGVCRLLGLRVDISRGDFLYDYYLRFWYG